LTLKSRAETKHLLKVILGDNFMIRHIKKIVLEILEENEYARKDDFRLYAEVLRKKGIDLKRYSLHFFLYTAKEFFKAPAFESVSRARRLVQKKRPDLVDKKTAEARAKAEAEIKEDIKEN